MGKQTNTHFNIVCCQTNQSAEMEQVKTFHYGENNPLLSAFSVAWWQIVHYSHLYKHNMSIKWCETLLEIMPVMGRGNAPCLLECNYLCCQELLEMFSCISNVSFPVSLHRRLKQISHSSLHFFCHVWFVVEFFIFSFSLLTSDHGFMSFTSRRVHAHAFRPVCLAFGMCHCHDLTV